MNKLTNKTALVTGGGTGIGRTIAWRLAEQGADVLILGRNADTLREAASQHARISWAVADVGQTDDIARAVREAKERFGRLDILVNNAGIAPVTPLANLDMDEFDQVYRVNVRGVVDMTRQALPLLQASRGTVINISSAVGERPMPGLSVYASSKAAVSLLGKAWAKELAADGIRVNSVSVGPIETPIYDKAGLSDDASQEHVDRVSQLIPLGRFGTSDEVASVVAFLASDEAGYVTGSDYGVDGGFAA